jgi:hypothetical protein
LRSWKDEAIVKATRQNRLGSYKVSGFNIPQTTLDRHVKDRQKRSSEAIERTLCVKELISYDMENMLCDDRFMEFIHHSKN